MRLVSPFALLGSGLRSVRAAGPRLLLAMLAFHLLILLVASPLIGWLFQEALRANGMIALDFGSMRLTGGIGISIALLVVILLLAFWIISLQFVVLVLMLHRARVGAPLGLRDIARDLRVVARKLLRPSSAPLICYLFFIIPLSGFGFVSALSQGIAVPSFISGELMKEPTTAAIWTGFMLLLALLNLRLALSLPLFALTEASGGRAMLLSWRLTRGWAAVRLFLAVVIVLLVAGIASLLLLIVAVLPTSFTDALAPAASVGVAAFSLGIAQTLGLLLTVLVTATVAAALLALIDQRRQALPGGLEIETPGGEDRTAMAPAGLTAQAGARARRSSLVLLIAGALIAVTLGATHIGTMQHLAQHPKTLVLGHRGFNDGGVENTIPGLEAAHAAGADLVEMDVLQTADKRFVVMHDAELSRLAGVNKKVKDLTLAELTAITVRDRQGHEAPIPSLEQYVTRAAELGMTLLIEIKLGGLDTEDHVELLVAELESLDAMQSNIFHTLDHASVERLKALRPDATVGYILAFAGGGVPQTSADFIVVEEWSATEQMQQAAERAGLGFFAWTVNEETGMRTMLRRDADGLITDHPDVALGAREEMRGESGLASVLTDAITRFVTVF